MKRWKMFLLGLTAFFVLFFIVTGFKTITLTSKQPEPHPIKIDLAEEDAVARFSKAITYPTISHQDYSQFSYSEFDGFLGFLEESYPLVHEQLHLDKVNEYGLIYRWQGSEETKEPIGLTAHYDVVPVLEGTETAWGQSPFSGEVVDGKIWGRGTLDDKIGVIGILEAVENLLSEDFQPERDVYLLFGFDEEVGGEKGAQAIAEELKQRNIKFEFILDEGGAIIDGMVPGLDNPVGVVGLSEKGMATAELSTEGSGGHSSQPENRTNIGRIARAITKLERAQFPADLQGPAEELLAYTAPEMKGAMKYIFANQAIFEPVIESILLEKPATAALLRTTIAPTIFQAGEQYNALPEKASAVVNLRVMPGDSLADVQSFIEETIDDDLVHVSVTGNEASSVSSVDNWHFKTIQQAARNAYPDAVIAPYLMFAGSDARHYDGIADNTYRFLPVLITAEDLNRMHGSNEHISIDNYFHAISFYREIIKTADKQAGDQ
ncbi:M20/M25/M40 family metallo-hydrolase [Sediminibacillus dalangtanensis]|uniref:M20/M25/M40 family metallo-hydrolase n=1 Tax=Sediminibacillus dalangtanensis TaxID=2729421 RepID=A0ABX7VXH6_9BACI|nr:M20 family peptidase [Sediminibacillus dalangtanensis]QTM99012.1 M20/M25/M40 family metallo-hydrolase [Sediminibacillus dalangtanensis]